jgi:phosphatidylinositol alpha-1,6-mannosyltransferase
MERLNLHMACELAKEFDVTVIGPDGCRVVLPEAIDVVEIAAKPLWRFFFGAMLRGVLAARRIRPHTVLAGSGLAAPFAWLSAKLSGARMAVYVHGLDLIAPHPIYRWFWLPCIRWADVCFANSRNTALLAVHIGAQKSRIVVVPPGVVLPAADPMPNDFRARFELGDRPLLLSVGRLIKRKGLLEFVENAMPQLVAAVPDVCLVVLGDELPDLLQGSSVGLGERIRTRSCELGIGHNVRFIGPQDDVTLAQAYRAADVHVFPVREVAGDVEGFGMVAVEAAAHGLPTVAFAVGGVPDAVEDRLSGRLVDAGDYQGLVDGILEVLKHRSDLAVRSAAARFSERFEWTNFGRRIRSCLHVASAAERSSS